MGIYSDYENIYGVNIHFYDDNDDKNIYIKQYQDTIDSIDTKEINELINIINNIKEEDKYNIFVYTDCSSSHDLYNNQKIFKTWMPYTLELLYKKITKNI
jgi:hypothetical protein